MFQLAMHDRIWTLDKLYIYLYIICISSVELNRAVWLHSEVDTDNASLDALVMYRPIFTVHGGEIDPYKKYR